MPIVVEGLYSTDGDVAELPRLIDIKQRTRPSSWSMRRIPSVHWGESGHGIREHYGLAGKAVDIWMGTLSKALAGCGGFIAGERALWSTSSMRHRVSSTASDCHRLLRPRLSRRCAS